MFRIIRSGRANSRAPDAPVPISGMPKRLCLSLDPRVNRCRLSATVQANTVVQAGTALASSNELTVHTPLSGTVREVSSDRILIEPSTDSGEDPAFPPANPPAGETLPAFAANMGLAGMGGSLFPSSIKLKAATAVKTLVVNAVECEPGIEIDMGLLLHDFPRVRAGMETLVRSLNIRKVVLAVKKSTQPWIEKVENEWNAGSSENFPKLERLVMPDTYPAGAEKLIIRKLVGRMLPTGVLPVRLGYLVISVASLWAIGRRILEGRPSLDRPLTLVSPGRPSRNLVAPLGLTFAELLELSGTSFDPARQILLAGGMMMGRQVAPDDSITKGTIAVFVQTPSARQKKTEDPCILCGACFDACPLGLHPIGMAERIRQGKDSPALKAHLEECFLCGACSAVCPANIPLAQVFREGRTALFQSSKAT